MLHTGLYPAICLASAPARSSALAKSFISISRSFKLSLLVVCQCPNRIHGKLDFTVPGSLGEV